MPYTTTYARSARARLAPPPAPPKPKPRTPVGTALKGLLLLLVLPATVFAGVLLYAKYEHLKTNPPPPGERGALVWSDGQVIFANTNEIAGWVKYHGGTFRAFKRNHPAALRLVTRRPASRVKLAAGAKKRPTASTDRTAVATTRGSGGGSSVRPGVWALGALAALLFILAALPTAVLWQIRIFRIERIPELRLSLVAAAVAIAAGLAVALI